LDPWQDEESSIIYDQWQVALAKSVGPTDILVSRCGLPCGSTKTQEGNDLLVEHDKVP
jgi:hypothetical protein